MPQSHMLSIRKDVSLSEHPDGQVVLQGTQIKFVFNPLPLGILAALRVLLAEGATEEELSNLVLQEESPSVIPYLYLCIHQLNALKVICRTVLSGDVPLATLIPTSSQYEYHTYQVEPETKYVLSRFAYCHQDDAQIILESPLAHARLVLHTWQASALWVELKVPRNSHELSRAIPGVSIDTVQEYLGLLLNAQVLKEDKQESKHEQANSVLSLWEFHDLLFHSRSRLGRHTNPYGGTYRFVGKIEPLPAVKPRKSTETIHLFKPDLQHLKEFDPSFTEVLEGRKSIRQHNDLPLTEQQLGEFLFRTARVKSLIETDQGELSSRPYPSGGAIYELELYTIVNQCSDIPSGLYHYCPKEHELSKVSDHNQHVARLLDEAWYTTQKQCRPQILFILAARFPRVSWKYQSIAYALILKHVGVLYQTMYLVGTAMGLAPCALGGGDSDLFALAAGLDYYTETSVGEFILGSKAASSTLVLD